jgi:hypothetical protein
VNRRRTRGLGITFAVVVLAALLVLCFVWREPAPALPPSTDDGERVAATTRREEAAVVAPQRELAPPATVPAANVVTSPTAATGGTARITVVDDDQKPVRGAEVWLASRRIGGDVLDRDSTLPRGVTDRDGVTTISGIPHGGHFLHARHDVLVHSTRRLKEMGIENESSFATIGATPVEAVMHLTMPYVYGVQVVGGEMLYDSFSGAAGYHSLDNADGQWASERLRKQLIARFPGARILVAIRDFKPPHKGGYGNCLATVFVVGREAVRRRIEPVAATVFAAPLQLNVAGMPRSDEFGSIMVRVAHAGGPPILGLHYTLGKPHDQWRDDAPQVLGTKLMSGELRTVPVGTYEVTCQGLFEGQVLARNPEGLQIHALNRHGLQVRRGEALEVVIDSPVGWSRCRFSFPGEDITQPLTGVMLSLFHAGSGMRVAELLNGFEPPIEMWVPAGPVELRAEAPAADPQLVWRHVDPAFDVAGGTIESPQVIRCSLQRVKR